MLLHCYAQNQTPGKAEPLHFHATYRVQEGESAGVQGYPLFVGLSVGQDFDLGLDFSTTPMQGRLAEGAYIAVQIPESFSAIWDWDDWVYLPAKGLVVKRDNQQELIPYNYLVFGVSGYNEQGQP